MADKYTLLEPLPGQAAEQSGGFGYLTSVYQLGLTLCVVFALIMIVIAGVQYATSFASPSNTEDAKHRIWNAIGGLVLALISYMLLSTINPDLLSGNVVVPAGEVGGTSGSSGSGSSGSGSGNLPGTGQYGGPTSLTNGDARKDLSKNGIDQYDLPDCEKNGLKSPCGYFQGITQGLIDYVGQVNALCTNCELVARDATGPGHDPKEGHYSGEKIDFAPTASLDNFVTNNKDRFSGPSRDSKGFNVYTDRVTGATWTQEVYTNKGRNHWDVDTKPA